MLVRQQEDVGALAVQCVGQQRGELRGLFLQQGEEGAQVVHHGGLVVFPLGKQGAHLAFGRAGKQLVGVVVAVQGKFLLRFQALGFDLLDQRLGLRKLRRAQDGDDALQRPVVEGALVFELQRADAVGDVLQRVLDGVREGVHGVDAPAVAGVVVLGMLDAVDGRVAQVDVGAGHADLGAQHHAAVRMLAGAHLAKARQVLGGRAVAERAVLAGVDEVTAVGAHFFRRLLVHVGVAGLDQVLGGTVHEVEVVAGVEEVAVAMRFPAKAQPLDRVGDGVDVLLLLFLGVGVVKAHVADTVVVARQAEVQADALGVAHVQVAVGLGRETGADARRVGHAALGFGMLGGGAGLVAPGAAAVGAGGEVVLDDLAQEVAGLGRLGRFFFVSGNCWRAHGGILDPGVSAAPGRVSAGLP